MADYDPLPLDPKTMEKMEGFKCLKPRNIRVITHVNPLKIKVVGSHPHGIYYILSKFHISPALLLITGEPVG